MALEPAVGDVFEIDGKKYKCVEGDDCLKCDFGMDIMKCLKLTCSSEDRKDLKEVIFKLHTDELG